ncbi:rhodanese-like domain-containing protein [Streptomyces eurythermus]|uniref:rhodanese-like domain-containing protein n=1 Tax=Streptomyces eurythermus TaxID=42237 RepID=UPI0033EA4EEF
MRTSLFGRGGSGPGRVTVRGAALRTGGRGGHAPLLGVRESHERQAGHPSHAMRMPLATLADGVQADGVTGGIRDRAVAGPPAADAHGGDGTVA